LHYPTGLTAQGECNMSGLTLIYFNSPFIHPNFDLIDGGLEFHWGYHWNGYE
jgi:hypothetical protein